MAGNWYTYPLILPEVSIDDPAYKDNINPKATLLNCLDYALIYDDDFIQDCEIKASHVVSEHLKAALAALDVELAPPTTAPTVNCRELRISKYFDDLCDDDHTNMPSFQPALEATQFQELILQSISVNKICVETE